MKIEIQKIPYKIENKTIQATELFVEMGEKSLFLPIDMNLINEKELLLRVEEFVSQFKVKISVSSECSKGYVIKDE